MTIEFYWRPGCGFCVMLERNLDELGLPLEKLNIWDDPEHAASVRSITGGHETVPTVVVGGAQLVNPSHEQVLQAVSNEAPELLPKTMPLS